MNILVTGAYGFVGKALIHRLVEHGHTVTALVRKYDENINKDLKVKWLEGDLMQPETLPELGQIHKAYFLVHGLKSTFGSLEFRESMTAINFINWVRPSNPTIIYLGGLAPKEDKLSEHLRARILTGAVLGASGMSVCEFRASIVLGAGSVSFEMIKAISERLPFRPDLPILSRPCQPLSQTDLLKYLEAALKVDFTGHEIFEIGGLDVTSYGELIDTYAELAGLKRKKVRLPEVETKVIMKALDYAIPEHAEVGKKLAETLEHATVVTSDAARKKFPEIKPESVRVAMDLARSNSSTHYAPLWEKDFLKGLLSDKIMTQSGFLSPELLKNLEKVTKLKDILTRR